MHSPESTILSQPFPQSPTNRNEDFSLKERNMSEGLPQSFKTKHLNNEKDRSKNALIKLSKQIETCFCCFRGIHLKIGSTKFVITSGKIMLGCLLLFIYYVFRKKQATIKRYSIKFLASWQNVSLISVFCILSSQRIQSPFHIKIIFSFILIIFVLTCLVAIIHLGQNITSLGPLLF